jgi:putative transposase
MSNVKTDLAKRLLARYNNSMPQKNCLKIYVENGYYHVYNRGVEKRLIFQDDMDYGVFLSYLKEYLTIKDESTLFKKLSDPTLSGRERNKIAKSLRLKNYQTEITLLAYCLMPNHFHLFIKQRKPDSIDKFMRSLGTRYSKYFNHKNNRVGALFQDTYKAVLISNEAQFVYLSSYIHQQALALPRDSWQSRRCSYPEYIGQRKTPWVHPEEVLEFFSREKPVLSYESFVRDNKTSKEIESLTLEN